MVMGRDFRGQDRNNDTHASTTDPDARLYRKSNNAEARLAYLGHLLLENRHGLIVDAQATVADGFAEREGRDDDAQRALAVCAAPAPHRRSRQSL
jgi:hypothetical protein